MKPTLSQVAALRKRPVFPRDWRAWLQAITCMMIFFCSGGATANTIDSNLAAISLKEAYAQKPIDDYVRYLADKQGEYNDRTIFDHLNQFIPLSEKSVSLRTHTHWYWIRVHNPLPTEADWYITSGISTPPLLRGYWRSKTHRIYEGALPYDLYLPGQNVYQHPQLAIPLHLKPGETGDLLIEYQAIANFPLELRPFSRSTIIDRSQRLLFANGAYMGAIGVFFLFFATQFLIRPTRVQLFYSLFVLSIIFIMIEISGYKNGKSLEDGTHNSLITAIIGGSIYIWYFLFSTEFFELKEFNPKLHKVLCGLSISVFSLTLLGLFLPVDYLLSVVVVAGLPWPIVAALWAVRQKHRSAKFFLVGSATHCVTTYLLLIACLGFETSSNEYFFGLASIGLIFDVCCFAVAILYQNNQLRLQYNRQLQERINDLHSLTESEQISAKALSMSKQAVLNTAATAHDLQQPLSSMQMMISLQDQSDPIVKQTKDALDYARALLSSALNSSKAEYQIIQENINPKSLLLSAVKRHNQAFSHKKLTLKLRCPDTEIVCLPLVINRMLDNLLSNAAKYTPEGSILISGRKRRNGSFLIQVWDTGHGMSASQVKKILTPFERLNENGTDSLGFGLGLFIVKSLCNQAGYTLNVRSREGRGSCFSITIPIPTSVD